jgi:hypothetical protein
MPIEYCSVDEIRREIITQLSTADDPALAKLITWTSRMIDRKTNRQRGFSTSTGDETLTFDGPSELAYTFRPQVDIASLTTLNLALDSVAASSGTYTSISTADYFLRPSNRPPGWPAWEIQLASSPNGTYAFSTQPFTQFNPGINTIQLVGKFGWNTTSIESTNFPQEIRLVAVEVAVKAWRTRETGYSNTFGASEVGIATIERQLSPFARDILEFYTKPAVA